ncbi:hypothetical protein [Nakamurella lactea]|uniref:hypothetical protein n=1 Tax=Nakamurella lactea TaxID=459515 RepID=UPI000429B100|nr:hypothetical protein [Nakamurella lactea]
MLLILCPLDDLDALAFAHRATAEGTGCRILTAEALSFAGRRSHRIVSPVRGSGAPISVRTEIEALGLPPINDEQVSGVLNRLIEPPASAWRRATAVERDYATAELFAFTISWLSGFECPVRNRPTASCLAGPAPHPLRAVVAAQAAGLECPDLRYGSDTAAAQPDLAAAAFAAAGPGARARQVVCLDGMVLSDGIPADPGAGVVGLLCAIGADADLVGVDFAVRGDHWVFAGLTPLPALGGLGRDGRRTLLATLTPARTAVA